MRSESQRSRVNVTRPFLPPLSGFLSSLEEIWASGVLTNGGIFHQRLERALVEYLGVANLALVSNGTLGLLTALQALRVTGEVITTPYSFVATSHSLLWNGLRPIFVDIEPESLNIDPEKIEAAITPRTTAILAVHCYGRPCDVDRIQAIADAHNLKVIYDAAHAFGVEDEGGSILRHGDMSVLSFHATKVFNTFEGGAIVCHDEKTKKRIDNLKNFGFVDEVTVVAPGINGKMTEINSAFGLLQLQHIEDVLIKRADIDQRYRIGLAGVRGLRCLDVSSIRKYNYSYFPVLVGPEFAILRDELYSVLRQSEIFARRYFYPLITSFPMYRGYRSARAENLPVAFDAAQRILCLPIYPDLSNDDVDRVIDVIRQCSERRPAGWQIPCRKPMGNLRLQNASMARVPN
jgi:dTDP-4-amino-4,6-dideoxygalactose transaminase